MKDGRFPSSFRFVSVFDAMISLRCSSKAFYYSEETDVFLVLLVVLTKTFGLFVASIVALSK